MLLITGVALIGVNVVQLSCIHSDNVYLTVRMLPLEKDCPCSDECACCQEEEHECHNCCHPHTHHAFYKVADSSVVEREVQMFVATLWLPELCFRIRTDQPLIKDINFFPEHEIPELPPARELLCTFLC